MAEAAPIYEIFMKLGVENKATDVLIGIGKELEKLGDTAGVTMAKIAAATALMAAGIYEGISKLAEAGDKIIEIKDKLKNAGLSEEATRRMWDISQRVQVPGTSAPQRMDVAAQLHAITGKEVSEDELRKVVQAISAETLLMGGKDQTAAILRTIQAAGPRTGEDLQKILEYINTVVRISQSTQGKVTPEQVTRFYQYGGSTAAEMDKDFIERVLPQLLINFAATGAMARAGPGALIPEMYKELIKAQEGTKNAPPSPFLQGMDIRGTNPYEVAQKIAAAFKEQGITGDKEVRDAIRNMGITNEKVANLIADMVLHGREMQGARSPYETRAEAFARTPGTDIDRLKEGYEATAAGRALELAKIWESVSTQIGYSLAIWKGDAARPLLHFLESVSTFITDNPENAQKIATAVTVLGVALAGAAVAAGVAALVAAAPFAALIGGVIAAFGALVALDWKAAAAVLTAPFTANLGSLVTSLVKLGSAFAGDAVMKGVEAIINLINRIVAVFAPGSPGAAALGPSYLPNQPPSPNAMVANRRPDEKPAAPADIHRFHWTGWEGVSRAPKPYWEPPAPSDSAPAPGSFMWTPPQRMNYIPTGADMSPRLSGASWSPPPAPKPVTVAMTLNLDGRTLASALSTELADLHEFATGAPSSNSYADFVGADNQVAST